MEFIINQYKDPYETTRIMESKSFFFLAQLNFLHAILFLGMGLFLTTEEG